MAGLTLRIELMTLGELQRKSPSLKNTQRLGWAKLKVWWNNVIHSSMYGLGSHAEISRHWIENILRNLNMKLVTFPSIFINSIRTCLGCWEQPTWEHPLRKPCIAKDIKRIALLKYSFHYFDNLKVKSMINYTSFLLMSYVLDLMS